MGSGAARKGVDRRPLHRTSEVGDGTLRLGWLGGGMGRVVT